MSGEPPQRDPSAGGRPWLARPLKFTLCLTARCPLDCRPCYADCAERQGRGELDAATWLRLLDELAEAGVINVFVEGGEPLARPDAELILAHAARRMFTALRTHAVSIDRAAARRLARLGLGRAYVDLFGPDAATHDALAGVPGAFDRALAGIAALRAAHIPVSILTILCAPNAPALARMGDLALALGADELGVLRLYPLGRAKREWASLALSLTDQRAALDSLIAAMPAGLRLMHSWHPNDANCCWQNAAIDPGGHAIGCPYLREFVDYGDLARVTWEESWAHPLYVRLREGNVPVHCADCAARELTAGGCRATAFAFHRRWDAPDPYCEVMNQGVDLRVLPG
ncbi:radical SAM protein [Elioraea thermophila]|uniref:radical SAM protein n=1 Tax=Elioraea thermophila TaxID=2185104 RepID=UPI000DF2390E|nr:radical SAM protein [Elioraea thermophila]